MTLPVWTTCWPSACKVKVTLRTLGVRRVCGRMCGTICLEGHRPTAMSLPSSLPALTTTALQLPLKPVQPPATALPQTSCCLASSVKSSFQRKTLSYIRWVLWHPLSQYTWHEWGYLKHLQLPFWVVYIICVELKTWRAMIFIGSYCDFSSDVEYPTPFLPVGSPLCCIGFPWEPTQISSL